VQCQKEGWDKKTSKGEGQRAKGWQLSVSAFVVSWFWSVVRLIVDVKKEEERRHSPEVP